MNRLKLKDLVREANIREEEEGEGESKKFPGHYHLGGGYYATTKGGEAVKKSDKGQLRNLTPQEKQQKAAEKSGAAQQPATQQPAAQQKPEEKPKAEKPAAAPAQQKPAQQTPAQEPKTKSLSPEEKKAEEEYHNEQHDLSHEEQQAYEFLDGVAPEQRAEAIDGALKNRSWWQKFTQDTIVGGFLKRKGQQLSNAGGWIGSMVKHGRAGVVQDCSGAPAGPHAAPPAPTVSRSPYDRSAMMVEIEMMDIIKALERQTYLNTMGLVNEAPQDRQAYLQSLGKDGKPRSSGEPTDKSNCKSVHYSDYQKRDPKTGKPMVKKTQVPAYVKGKMPDPGDIQNRKNWEGTPLQGSDIDPKTGYYKKQGQGPDGSDAYYDADGYQVDESGNQLFRKEGEGTVPCRAAGIAGADMEKYHRPCPDGPDDKGPFEKRQDTNFFGKPKFNTIEEPVYEDNLSPEQLKAAHESHHREHEQNHAMLHTVIEVAVIAASVAAPMLLHVGGAAAGAGGEVVKHTVGEIVKHTLKDTAKHAVAEMFGAPDAFTAAGAGYFSSLATGGILESSFIRDFIGFLNEGETPNKQMDSFQKILKQTLEKMKTFEMTPSQKLESLRAYKKQKRDKEEMNRLPKPKKEFNQVGLSKSRAVEIKNFVEYASKRLNLKETPKIKLVKEIGEKSALGGYTPAEKTIMVVNDGRMLADVLRTVAHEMVHYKQHEMGKLKNLEEAGRTGSKFENQANSIAGILMREYGVKNKKIYLEHYIRNKAEIKKEIGNIVKDSGFLKEQMEKELKR